MISVCVWGGGGVDTLVLVAPQLSISDASQESLMGRVTLLITLLGG